MLAFTCALANGDTLGLAGGDTLTGVLIEVGEGVLVFRTAFAGLVITPTDEVHSLSTDTYFTVVFADGKTVVGRFRTTESGTDMVSPDGQVGVQQVDFRAIAKTSPFQFKPGPSPPPELPEGEAALLTGEFEAGYLRRFRESERSSIYSRILLSKETDDYRVQFTSFLGLDDAERFPHLVDALAEWQFMPKERLRPELYVGAERDLDRGLKLRATLGAGLSHTVWEREDARLEIGAGLNAALEYFERFPSGSLLEHLEQLTQYGYYKSDRRPQDQDLNVYFHLRHRQEILERLSVGEELRFYSDVTDLGAFRASSDSSLRYALTQRLTLRINLRVDYESEPAFHDLDRWSSALGAGLAWGF